MKRLILIVTILTACIFQSEAQDCVDKDTVTVPWCANAPYYKHIRDNGMEIEYPPGLYCETFPMIGPAWLNIISVANPPPQHKSATLCQNKMLHFYNLIINGAEFPLGDTTLQATAWGYGDDCDTTMILHLTVTQVYDYTIKDQICVGEPYLKNGFYLAPHDLAGPYSYTHNPPLKSHCGCDSIVTLKLTVNPKKEVKIYAEICEGDIYWKNGFKESTSGIYTQYLSTAEGCDSTVILNLTVHNFKDTLEVNVCNNNLPFFYQKKSNNEIIKCVPGLQIVDTIRTGTLCDSIIYLYLDTIPNLEWYQYKTLCQNEVLNFYGNNINGADYSVGNDTLYYFVPSSNSKLCDTLMKLILTVLPVYNDTIEAQICVGEPYLLNGFGLDEQTIAGTFYHTINPGTHHGCDSIVTLKLTVNPRKETIINAEICEGDTYSDYNFNESTSGVFTQNLSTAGSCDSTVILNLIVHNLKDTLEVSVCNNNLPYYYQKKSNNEIIECVPGLQLVDIIPTGTLCDSLIYLNLDTIPNLEWYQYALLCQNETLNFHGNIINEGKDYPVGNDTLYYFASSFNPNNCDTLMKLILTVTPAYNDTIEAQICEGDSYLLNGFLLPEQNTAGTFFYTKNQGTHHGCDSVVTLQLTVNPKKTTTIYAEICDGYTYSENGFNESTSGTYTNYETSALGCDSTAILILTVHNNVDTLERSVCENKLPYLYQKKSNNEIIECMPGYQIVDTILTGGLCDSIIYLHLELTPNLEWYQYEKLCQNETLNFYGNIINGANYPLGNDTLYYFVSSLNPNSCDTLMKLILTVVQAYNDTIEDQTCVGEPYINSEYGFSLEPHDAPGTYYHYNNLQNQHDCDSIITLKLTVNPQKTTTIYAEICEGETYSENGFNESTSGTYTNYETSAMGCDSTATLFLTVYNAADTLERETCSNEPYYYIKHNGFRVLCEEGLQSVDTIHTGGLCDLVIYVNLTVIENPDWYEYERICQNKTLNFHNHIIHGADYPVGLNTLHFTVPSAYDCDTLMTVFLTVVAAHNDTIKDEICLGEPYYSNGFGLLEQNNVGTFYFTNELINQYGCDSIVTLELTVHPHKDTTIYDTICVGETYLNYGFNIDETEPGEYQYIDSVTNGRCKYAFTLNLTILQNLKMDSLSLPEICGDAASFPINYNIFDGKIDNIFVSFDEKELFAGFEDFVEHNPSIDHITIQLPPNVLPDNYSVTLYVEGRCSDTTFTVNFTVLYPSSVMEQRWNDVIILKNSAYNGGYVFYDNEWLVNGEHIFAQYDKGSYIYTENSTLQFGSEYRALLTRVGQYQSICSCPLIPVPHSKSSDPPHLVSGKGKIKIFSKEPIAELTLMNILGQTIRSGHFANTEIEINADTGIYIIRLVTDKGQIYTQKIIVQ